MAAFGRDIGLAPDYWLYLVFFGKFVEFKCAEHVAVIGDGCSRHPKGTGGFKKVLEPDRAVKQAVLGMNMQMNKRHLKALPSLQ